MAPMDHERYNPAARHIVAVEGSTVLAERRDKIEAMVRERREQIERGQVEAALRNVRNASATGQRDEQPELLDVYVACRAFCDIYEKYELG